MKKITALSLSAISYLAIVPSAFGATPPIVIDPCSAGRFHTLCDVASGGIGPLIGAIIQILFVVATLLALGFLIFGGIKWIVSGGDKAKVEAARGTIVAALVGLVLVFVSYFILNFVFQFFGIELITNDFNIGGIGL